MTSSRSDLILLLKSPSLYYKKGSSVNLYDDHHVKMTNGRKTNQNRLCKSFAMKVFSTREINAEVIAALLFVILCDSYPKLFAL